MEMRTPTLTRSSNQATALPSSRHETSFCRSSTTESADASRKSEMRAADCRSVGRLFGGCDHVVDPENEDVVRVVFAVDGAIDDEFRERCRTDGDGIALVNVADASLHVDLCAAEFRMVHAREVDFLDDRVTDGFS